MNSVIKKLFQEYSYEIEDFEMGYVALKNTKEYFIVSEYDEQEIQQFFDCERTNGIVEQYMQQQSNHSDFKKNCSLIICCNVQDIEKFKERNISKIFKIEEDEYYFRKYILIYTDEGLKGLRGSDSIGVRVNEIVQDTNSLDMYQKSINNNEEYSVAVQIMVKLPFLNFILQNNKFVTIEQEIKSKLIVAGKDQNQKDYTSFSQLLEDTDDNLYFEKLERAILSSEENDDLLNSFTEAFRG
ncbi:ABC-three component system middle component 1 [Acetobacterium carbinolicum]|uniref:ABC-three component system middle component 1 n=1 Tax=Acetobacterium carbinolicum TaxID=52690 RepID=UPI003BF51132